MNACLSMPTRGEHQRWPYFLVPELVSVITGDGRQILVSCLECRSSSALGPKSEIVFKFARVPLRERAQGDMPLRRLSSPVCTNGLVVAPHASCSYAPRAPATPSRTLTQKLCTFLSPCACLSSGKLEGLRSHHQPCAGRMQGADLLSVTRGRTGERETGTTAAWLFK